MPMRDYEDLKDIEIHEEQEKIMNVFCDAWGECRSSDCKECQDRPANRMSVMECSALKYSRLLVKAGYKLVKHGKWVHHNEGCLFKKEYYTCSICDTRNGLAYSFNYCPNCGAKMDGGKK